MIRETDQFYLNQSEPNKSCFLALRSIILAQDHQITETIKYRMPCFTYKKKAICYLWADNKTLEPYILMVEGKLLHHPDLEAGDRKRMKILRINPHNDLPVETIHSVLKEVLDMYPKG